jgi:hypothetical protein
VTSLAIPDQSLPPTLIARLANYNNSTLHEYHPLCQPSQADSTPIRSARSQKPATPASSRMFGIPPHHGHMHRPKHFHDSFSRGGESAGHDLERERERLLAHLFRQRRGGVFPGSYQHPALGGMGAHQPPLSGAHGMPPMMGGFPRQGFPPPMGIPPGMGLGMGMGMPGMGPHMGYMGMGTGLGRPPFGHSPFEHHSPFERQRPSLFGYGGPGPPRAHPSLPQHHHGCSPFSSRTVFENEDDDFGDDYRMPPRRGLGRQMRGGYRFASRHPSRRRGPWRSFSGNSEDDFDDYDEYDDEFGEDDGFEQLFSRQPAQPRWRVGY